MTPKQLTTLPRIYLCALAARFSDDVIGIALAEDGTCLAQHLSSTVEWSIHDMGFSSEWKHDDYKAHYPDGFVLEWISDPDTNENWKRAYELNQRFCNHARE